MGDHFHTVLKPRIQKVMYSSEWKDGQPQNTDGISHIFKYLTLEQYEDTLNNIDFMEGGTVQKTLMDMDGYVLRYMLDFETRESPCRMNTTKLERPFEYTLRITKDSEMHDETVDLVETFNYLLGLKVKRVRTFAENGTTYRVVHGETLERSGNHGYLAHYCRARSQGGQNIHRREGSHRSQTQSRAGLHQRRLPCRRRPPHRTRIPAAHGSLNREHRMAAAKTKTVNAKGKAKPSSRLAEHLILAGYMHGLFNKKSFDEMQALLNGVQEGYDEEGKRLSLPCSDLVERA